MNIDAVIEAALSARDRAYVPYSEFPMGAAVLTSDGTILRGVLVENVSLGLAMCAERVALFSSVVADQRPVALVLASRRTDGEITFPCGACLQVALELGGPDLIVAAVTPENEVERGVLGDLLPRGPRKN